MTTEQQELKAYVEDISKNNTCHRPDISCYDVCDDCPYTEYCLCDLNTKNMGNYLKSKRRRKRRKK